MRREGTIQALMKLRGLAIRKIEAIPVAIPLIRPLKWARGQINVIDNVIVVVTLSNGVQGIADAPPLPGTLRAPIRRSTRTRSARSSMPRITLRIRTSRSKTAT